MILGFIKKAALGISSVNDQQRATKKKSVCIEVNGRTASTLLHLPVGVHPHPHLWSQVLGNPPPPQKKRLWTPIVQMSFLQRVAGFSHGERSFHIHIETTQMKLFWDLKGCLLGEGITGMSYC